MTDIGEFHRELIVDAQIDAQAAGIFTVESFFDQMTEILCETGELETAHRCFFEGQYGNANMRVDGYGGDPRDADGVLSLIICDFHISDGVQPVHKDGLNRQFRQVFQFLRHSLNSVFRESIEETSAGFGLADLIAGAWARIAKVKLILLTNRLKRTRTDAHHAGEIRGIPVTYNIWDLSRLHRYLTSKDARDDLTVNFEEEFDHAVPVLRASIDEGELESYLAVISGLQLGQIYEKWGTRLLESNVRCFLQARSKVNRGIRDTIRSAPRMFFSYNNGISATAAEIKVERRSGGPELLMARDLQIVNGGQTTASIHAALKDSPEMLKDVFVQMKLTVVPGDRSADVVPNISEFANSQNRVNNADFFSNHPFHIRMEEFSRRVLAPAPAGEYRETKWFYERARGQYVDARARLSVGERRKFDLEFPRSQYFTKTDLAKFEFSYRGLPHVVSGGAQKNFGAFARELGREWKSGSSKFGKVWYQRLIGKAILFRTLERAIPRQDWYGGGYRANVVTYAIAKLVHEVLERGRLIDLDLVWRVQRLPEQLERACLQAAESAHEVIVHPPDAFRNMSEWAKKEQCWTEVRKKRVLYAMDFESVLTDPEEADRRVKDEERDDRDQREIDAQIRVVKAGTKFWAALHEWGLERGLLSSRSAGILATCASFPERMPSERQCVAALREFERLRAAGFSEDLPSS